MTTMTLVVVTLFAPCVLVLLLHRSGSGSSEDTDFKPQEYARAMVRGIESVIGRESTTRFTVLADTRGHQALGFEGKAVFKIWSHLAAMSKAFQTYFPERLRRFIVYPAGDVEMGAYRLFKALISKETVKRVTDPASFHFTDSACHSAGCVWFSCLRFL